MASLKCSKSDLAVVVHDHYEKNNLGLIVRIERYAGSRPIETFKPSNPFKPVGHRNMRCWQVRRYPSRVSALWIRKTSFITWPRLLFLIAG